MLASLIFVEQQCRQFISHLIYGITIFEVLFVWTFFKCPFRPRKPIQYFKLKRNHLVHVNRVIILKTEHQWKTRTTDTLYFHTDTLEFFSSVLALTLNFTPNLISWFWHSVMLSLFNFCIGDTYNFCKDSNNTTEPHSER